MLLLLAAATTAVAMPMAYHEDVHALERAEHQEECMDMVREAKEGCIGCNARDFRQEVEAVFDRTCDAALGNHFICERCEECIANAPSSVLDTLHQKDERAICGFILGMPRSKREHLEALEDGVTEQGGCPRWCSWLC